MNPFKFFTDILHYQSLEKIKNEFYFLADNSQLSYKEEWIKIIEFENDGTAIQYTMHFKDYLNSLFIEEKIKSYDQLSSVLLTETSNIKEAIKRLAIIISEWNTITHDIKSSRLLQKYKLVNHYTEISIALERKLFALEQSIKPKPYKVDSVSTNKIQWLGKNNQLVTLFYDLMNEHTNNGRPYIQSSVGNIAAFIENNFLSKDGNSIPRSSIDTGLKPSKMAKRASGNSRLDITKYSK